MKEKRDYELIVAVVNTGHDDIVMQAAKSAGARGGTLLHARATGVSEAQKFLGITVQPERDVLLLLVEGARRNDVMRAVCAVAGINTPAHGVLFSLPVDEAAGLTPQNFDLPKGEE